VSVTVNKANPSVTVWPMASAITYGQTLASSTLSGGTVTPPGTFAFTSPSTTPSAGTAPQSVTYTPTDTADYNIVAGTVNVTVNKAPLRIIEPIFTSKSTFQLTILTELGTTYVLVYTDSLASGSWTPIGNPVVGNGQTVTLEDPAPSGAVRFYLVRVQ
jgi:hypothetical protein